MPVIHLGDIECDLKTAVYYPLKDFRGKSQGNESFVARGAAGIHVGIYFRDDAASDRFDRSSSKIVACVADGGYFNRSSLTITFPFPLEHTTSALSCSSEPRLSRESDFEGLRVNRRLE